MPTVAHVDVVRHLYQAIADRDFVAAASCFAEGVVWHLPGNSPIAGDPLDITACQLITVRGGLIHEVRGHY
jgi:hypothetical protein